MRFFTLCTVVLGAVASAAPIAKRDAATVETDFTTISSSITAFGSAVNDYAGGLLAALPVASAATTLDSAVKQATTDIDSSSAFSAADSTAITAANAALVPEVESSVDALIAKEPQFAAAGVNSIVLSSLNTIQTDTAALTTALASKVQSGDAASVTSAGAEVSAALQSAITAFS